jgi:hypothetical protein
VVSGATDSTLSKTPLLLPPNKPLQKNRAGSVPRWFLLVAPLLLPVLVLVPVPVFALWLGAEVPAAAVGGVAIT